MKAYFLIFLLLYLGIFPSFYGNEEDQFQNRLDILMKKMSKNSEALSTKKCLTCTQESINSSDALPSVLVFVSFSLADGVWLSLSEDLKKLDGAFVLMGIPQNSFKELAQKIYKLRQQGPSATIPMHPRFFIVSFDNLIPPKPTILYE